MVPDIQPKLGRDTRGLLRYLYGPGRHDEHQDPHIVAAWLERGVPDPGRDPDTTLTELARFLDVPVTRLMAEGTTRKNGHVWHCPVAIAPTDRLLSDAEWAMVARRIVHATGIAPAGDPMACRWIAVRHDPRHIHILATAVREDGRAPRRHKDGQRAQDECRKLEIELGLRQLNSGDKTAARRPTSPEVHKAQTHGWDQPSRVWLQEQIREALAVASTPSGFFDLLEGGLGVHVRPVREDGEIVGYRVNRPGDVNAQGKPVWFAAGNLAQDLSWPNVKARLATNPQPEEHPTARRTRPEHPLLTYTDALDKYLVPALLADQPDDGGASGAEAQGYIVAFHESLTVLAHQAPPDLQAQLRSAEKQLARATRSQVRADHSRTRDFRRATRQLVDLATSETVSGGGDLFPVALAGVLFAVLLIEDWHARRNHQQQTDAARRAVVELNDVVERAAEQPLARLTAQHPATEGAVLDFARDLTAALPAAQAQKIAADPRADRLRAALADAAQRGHNPRKLVEQALRERELESARSPATVLALRVQRLGHQPVANPAAAAARLRTTVHRTTPATPAAAAANSPQRAGNRHR